MRATESPRTRSDEVRVAIRAAATILFTEQGFEATGIREIAEEAGVNPAIVIRHFESKEALFAKTMTLPDSWHAAFDGPLDEIGTRVVRLIAAGRTEGLRVYAALLQASGRPLIAAQLRATITSILTAPIVGRLPSADAELRAHFFAAQLEGLMSALAVREDPLLLSLTVDELAERFGSLLQRTLTD